jgi:hypothetical protein
MLSVFAKWCIDRISDAHVIRQPIQCGPIFSSTRGGALTFQAMVEGFLQKQRVRKGVSTGMTLTHLVGKGSMRPTKPEAQVGTG